MAASSPGDTLQTVVSVMDTLDGLRPAAVRAVVNDPVDVSRRVTQVYADQGIPLDAHALAQGMTSKDDVDEEGLTQEDQDFLDHFPLGSSTNLTEIWLVLGILVGVAGLVFQLFTCANAARKVNATVAVMEEVSHQPWSQALATVSTSDTRSTMAAVEGQVTLKEDGDHRPMVTLTAPRWVGLAVGRVMMDQASELSKTRVDVWANGQRVHQTKELETALACGSESTCTNTRPVTLTLQSTPKG